MTRRTAEFLPEVRYKRSLDQSGSKVLDAVVYSVSGVDGWRLSSVWPVDVDAMISCAET